MNTFLNNWSPCALSILRIVTGFLFIWHGSQKLLGFPALPPGADGSLSPSMLTAGVLELFGGGVLFLLGLFTRPVAFILCGMMAVAYFTVHAPNHFLPLVNQGELAVIYCFVFLYFIFTGGGAWSLDRLIWREKI
ncbi:MAG: DoxX family protein [Pyrinomonadaceae bacterium]